MIDEVPLLANTHDIGPYYELIILSTSGLPRGSEIIRQCSDCGYVYHGGETREFTVYPSMWKGDDIFFMATTLYMVITDSLKRKLMELKPTNIRFKNITAAK